MYTVYPLLLIIIGFAVVSVHSATTTTPCSSKTPFLYAIDDTYNKDTYGPTKENDQVAKQIHEIYGDQGIKPQKPTNGAGLVCTENEGCVTFSKVPICMNFLLVDFRDADGTAGSLITGDYERADGRKGNLYTGSFPVPDNDDVGSSKKNPSPDDTVSTDETGGATTATATSGGNGATTPTATAATDSPVTPTQAGSAQNTAGATKIGGAARRADLGNSMWILMVVMMLGVKMMMMT